MEVRINNVSKRFGKSTLALDEISLTIGPGMFGLLGPNGAGKTTLMRIISTLLLPTSGDVLINQFAVTKNQVEIRRELGYLPQSFNPYPGLTVEEFLEYMALLSDIEIEKSQIEECLEKVNLIEQRRTRAAHLSGGMKRRLGIAQAIINNPKLLIVDEPTAGLDPVERVRFRNLLSTMSASRTVILSTHIVEDVASTCSNLAVLNRGKIIFTGSPQQLAKQADGKVWNVRASEDRKQVLEQRGNVVISAVFANDQWELKILNETQPTAESVPIFPAIEDGYMYLMRANGK